MRKIPGGCPPRIYLWTKTQSHRRPLLALAQEVESNHERYTFASSFARSQEDRDKKLFPKAQERQQANPHANPQPGTSKNPYFNQTDMLSYQIDMFVISILISFVFTFLHLINK